MNKTNIDWCDYTVNPIKGLCPVGCPYCYARRIYKRFKWDTEIRFHGRWWSDIDPDKPVRIFVGSTMELFGDWIPDEWIRDIFRVVKMYPRHTFIFLTKQPQNLIKYSPFPGNCWIGFTATDSPMFCYGVECIREIEAKVKFVSVEPLLGDIFYHRELSRALVQSLDWVIVGQQTPIKKETTPNVEWVKEIVQACDDASIPVFLKNNLGYLLTSYLPSEIFCKHGYWYRLRQEFPQVKLQVEV
jgi:protein gp37